MTDSQKADAAEDTAALGPSPARERVVSFNGRQIKVTPLRMRQLPAFAAAVKPLLGELGALVKKGRMTQDAALSLVQEHTAHVIAVVSAATDVELHELGDADAAEFLELALAVLRVNLDFFVHRLPVLARALPQLDEMNGGGLTRSKP